MNKPYLTGVSSVCMLGSNKIIVFVCQSTTTTADYSIVTFSYPESFTFNVTELDYNLKFKNEHWYDNYNFTYKYSQRNENMIINISENINDKTIKVDKIDVNVFDFQIGDYYTDKIMLSNGDIIFNNFGDVQSCLIYTKNNPKVNIYKIKPNHKNKSIIDKTEEQIINKKKGYNVKEAENYFKKISKYCDKHETFEKIFI